jgi:RND family efflux transporter MFP subunit
MGQLVTSVVKRGDLIETVSATGSIAAQTGAEVHIGTQVTGRIKHLYADVGQVLKAGDLIAQLDLPDLQDELAQAKSGNAAADSKLRQQRENVTLGLTQTQSAIALARASLNSARQSLKSTKAAAMLQTVQTPSDIRKADAFLSQATATLTTAESSLVQVQAGSNLQIQTSEDAVRESLATDAFNQTDLTRQQMLGAKGYVADTTVQKALQSAALSHAEVLSAQHALDLTKQLVTANLQAAVDVVSQDQEGVKSARAALQAAQGETFTTAAKYADVADAEAVVAEAGANLQLALGNLTSNAVHVQDVRQASDALAEATDQLGVNQVLFDRTFIRTPISGTVLQLAAQQGETLAAGLAAPTLIVVADLTKLEVDAFVDENDIGKVKIGQSAKISVDAFPGLALTGKVAKVASGSTIQQGVVTYVVTVYIDDTKHELRPDMTANITIQTGKLTNVLLAPAEAVTEGVSGSTVNVIGKKNGKSVVIAAPVQTGGTDGVSIEIVSGLTEGQTIVLAGGQSGTGHTGGASSPFGPTAGGGGGGGGHGGG